MQILRCGVGFTFFVFAVSVLSGFHLANWEEYHTGVLNTQFSGFGVTESHVTLQLIILMQALTNGSLSSITMRSIGSFILPSVEER